MNDDVRSPGSQSTPGPLSAQPPPGLDTDPGESKKLFQLSTKKINKYHELELRPICLKKKKKKTKDTNKVLIF